jgi:hypothetical protein
MAKQGDRSDDTVFVTGSIATPVASGTILAADPANPGNAKVSTAGLRGFMGVTLNVTQPDGYVLYRSAHYVQIIVGASTVNAGDLVTSDASGLAATFTPAASGGAVKQVVGVALNTATTGTLVDVLLQPMLSNG